MKVFFAKIEYEILIFLFLMIKMFYEIPYYKMMLSIVATIFICVFISYVLAGFIRNASETERKTVIVFVAFLLGSSIINSIVCAGHFINRGLTLENIFFIFCLFITFGSIEKAQNKWRIPIICFACCAIQPTFVFVMIPTITILLLYNFYSSNKSTESLWLIAASLIACVAALLLVGRELTVADNFSIVNIAELNWKNIVYSLIIIFPIIIINNLIWFNVIKSSKDKKFRLIVILIMLEPFVSVLALAFNEKNIDLVMVSAFVQFCFLFYFMYVKNPAFLAVFNKTVSFFEKNTFLVLIILIYLSAFSLFRNNTQIGNWLGY